MKIRNGFVSNSSSSSFVVAFKETPKNANELKTVLFGEREYFPDPTPVKHNEFKKTSYFAKIIFKDMKKGPAPIEKIEETLSSGYMFGCPEYSNEKYKNKGIEGDFNFDLYDQDCQKYAKEMAKEFLNKNKDSKIYVFEYSDNEGSDGSILEHCGTFEKLPHITISHH